MTRRQVLHAIAIDFNQYPCQLDMWREISPLVFGSNARIVEGVHPKRLWLVTGRRRRMRPVKEKELGMLLIRELETSALSLECLAHICERIFRTNVRAGPSTDSGQLGLYLETGMDEFACRKCGECCRALDYHDQLTQEDYLLFQKLDRKDILEWIRPVNVNGRVISYRIWVPPGALSVAPVCPWLKPTKNNPQQFECAIHDVKPEICRQYPGSRKHAVMTGCIGFD